MPTTNRQKMTLRQTFHPSFSKLHISQTIDVSWFLFQFKSAKKQILQHDAVQQHKMCQQNNDHRPTEMHTVQCAPTTNNIIITIDRQRCALLSVHQRQTRTHQNLSHFSTSSRIRCSNSTSSRRALSSRCLARSSRAFTFSSHRLFSLKIFAAKSEKLR